MAGKSQWSDGNPMLITGNWRRCSSNNPFKILSVDDLLLHVYMTFVHPAKDFKNPAIYLHHIFGLITLPFSAVGRG